MVMAAIEEEREGYVGSGLALTFAEQKVRRLSA